ncbi:Cytochrome P450 E-class group I [Penicillium cosmopolitanum]|uniref:Cytochrome P450 E-class group I n=1 Tax=Penicillium cosmopolitanum TaxID=1131564 RepID=A0A9W9S1Y7_9EURO|nr:Cytochrome P450 E-class group I [Penicillium cosmopolitanum]KAJ5369554.1 Cytochrome P450 E-class group I [Penicillium cosmopolitanum]
MTTIVNYEGAVERINAVLMRKFGEFADTLRLVDLPVFLQYYAFDVIASITMDRNFDMMETERDRTGFLHKIKVATKHHMSFGPFPFLHVVLARVAGLLKMKNPHNELFQFIAESVERFRQLGSKPSENQMSEPFLAKLLDLERKGKINEGSIFSSCGSNVIAGSDTTAITLSAAFYYIYRNPIVLGKLRDEIDARERAGLLSNPARFKEAQQMPYLQAIIKETLRMHPAVAQMLPREVPQNGVLLSGYKFPAKTQVGISAWALHYNPDLIDSPRAFRPERWLEDHGHTLPSSALNFAFGGGSRICLGRNISLLELTKVIPEVVRHFDIRFENPDQPWKLDVGWFTWSSYKCWIEKRKPAERAV